MFKITSAKYVPNNGSLENAEISSKILKFWVFLWLSYSSDST